MNDPVIFEMGGVEREFRQYGDQDRDVVVEELFEVLALHGLDLKQLAEDIVLGQVVDVKFNVVTRRLDKSVHLNTVEFADSKPIPVNESQFVSQQSHVITDHLSVQCESTPVAVDVYDKMCSLIHLDVDRHPNGAFIALIGHRGNKVYFTKPDDYDKDGT